MSNMILNSFHRQHRESAKKKKPKKPQDFKRLAWQFVNIPIKSLGYVNDIFNNAILFDFHMLLLLYFMT